MDFILENHLKQCLLLQGKSYSLIVILSTHASWGMHISFNNDQGYPTEVAQGEVAIKEYFHSPADE